MSWSHIMAMAGADLRRLFKSKDYWIPLMLMAGLFFVIIPFFSLSMIGSLENTQFVDQVTQIVGQLPDSVSRAVAGETATARASYVVAVFLLAPIAIIVPLTISAAVGSNAIVGERERGTGEFLAHSPLKTSEIYIGKLIASLVPGYLATFVGFSLYALIVNLTVGPSLGGWFFPTRGWLVLILWVIPPFIAIALSLILRLSARVRSAAAAQQASSLVTLPIIIVSYAVAAGVVASPGASGLWVGAVAWVVAGLLITRGAKTLQRDRLLGVASET
ncbi:MAG: ABC transporter permease subunit [Actinobacteria bacterium]|nr:ABC transporter permease subunit [Actinomycetota bacterium]